MVERFSNDDVVHSVGCLYSKLFQRNHRGAICWALLLVLVKPMKLARRWPASFYCSAALLCFASAELVCPPPPPPRLELQREKKKERRGEEPQRSLQTSLLQLQLLLRCRCCLAGVIHHHRRRRRLSLRTLTKLLLTTAASNSTEWERRTMTKIEEKREEVEQGKRE